MTVAGSMARGRLWRLWVWVWVLAGAAGPGGGAVWPQPQHVRVWPGGSSRLVPARFRFGYARGSAVGPGCAVLDQAFLRYWRLLFAAQRRPPGEGGRQAVSWVGRPMGSPRGVEAICPQAGLRVPAAGHSGRCCGRQRGDAARLQPVSAPHARQKGTGIQVCSRVMVPPLLYGCEM